MSDPLRRDLRRLDVEVGPVYCDPFTGGVLRVHETAASSRCAVVACELEAQPGWSAGPLHVHPHQAEELTVLEGELAGRRRDRA